MEQLVLVRLRTAASAIAGVEYSVDFLQEVSKSFVSSGGGRP